MTIGTSIGDAFPCPKPKCQGWTSGDMPPPISMASKMVQYPPGPLGPEIPIDYGLLMAITVRSH